jgi:hypothetical protein
MDGEIEIKIGIGFAQNFFYAPLYDRKRSQQIHAISRVYPFVLCRAVLRERR